MSGSRSTKLVLLTLDRILREQTDEQHPLTARQLEDALLEEGYSCERKAVYRHLDALKEFGVDILRSDSVPRGYYVASRDFELPELRLLIDAVQSSRFISYKKSEELIEKLSRLASRSEAAEIRRGLHMHGTPKTDNERVYYTLDTLYRAMAANRRVSFRYFDYDPAKKKIFREEGRPYLVSPYAVVWDDEKYYLHAYHEKYDDIAAFRIDRMEDAEVSPLPRLKADEYAAYDPSARSRTAFDQFGGEPTAVVAEFDNRLANAVIDRFGDSVSMRPVDSERFIARFSVEMSERFLSWLFGFGTQVKVIAPADLVRRYAASLEEVRRLYD